MQVEVIQETVETRYTLNAVIVELSRYRGKRVPKTTFYKWRNDAGIEKEWGDKVYTQEEVDKLKRACDLNKQATAGAFNYDYQRDSSRINQEWKEDQSGQVFDGTGRIKAIGQG